MEGFFTRTELEQVAKPQRTIPGEVWEWAKGYKRIYQVSNLGNVRSVTRLCPRGGRTMRIKGKIKELQKDKAGYAVVNLHKNGIEKNVKIHRLVAKIFIPNPFNKPEVNHKDGNKQNNCVSNLEWVTPKENGQHASVTGLLEKKLRKKQVYHIKRRLRNRQTIASIARRYSVSESLIRFIKQDKIWRHV